MRTRGWLVVLALWIGLLPAAKAEDRPHWVGVWATSQLIPQNENVVPAEDLTDATLRQVVRISLGGRQLRVRLSNAFGTAPLEIGAASVARSAANATSRVDPATLKRLTFGGEARIVIPAGADYWSDPIPFSVEAGADLAISLHLPKAPDRQTGHPGSRASSHFGRGEQVGATELAGARIAPRWLVIGGVEVDATGASALVILGDSITDGYGVQPDTNQRWPDALIKRMRADPTTRNMAVLNAGIGGNRLRLDGLGPSALARFDREVLSVPGISHLIVIEGVNDLGTLTRDAPASPEQHRALVREMIGVLRQIVLRARAHGIKVIGGTIMPYGASGYYHPDAANEADRAAVNAWIRAPGNFDAVIDFDAAMRDPAQPTRLRAELDSGDGLHPSMVGYRAMADAVPLSLLSAKAWRSKATKREPAPEIAFTFDDLPAHATLPPGETHVQVAERITGALRAARAPATGFINGARIEREPETAPVLDVWRAAGLPLANHGWSHAGLDAISDDRFAEELAKNEPLLREKMGKADWRWFRYPFLAEARADPERRARIRQLLASKGYKVAAVTMDFSDWAYNDAYARCMAMGDRAAVAQMEAAWLAAADASADRSRAAANALYGRDIPYVLLMHQGSFDARMLPRLLDLYRRKGFRFVTLAEAQRDPHYRSDMDPTLPPQPQHLDDALAAKRLAVPPSAPAPSFDSVCR